jgi:hypothetical protein
MPEGGKRTYKKVYAKAKPYNTKTGKLDDETKEMFLNEHAAATGVKLELSERRKASTCACCGALLSESTGVRVHKAMYPSGFHPMCLHCQQRYYADIASNTSRTYALFYACIAFCVPYNPEVIETMAANQNGVWYEYVKRLQRPYVGLDDPQVEVWTDGITDIKEAFGGEFPVLAITTDVLVSNMSEMPDEERWKVEWGTEWEGEEDYRYLDNRYRQLTSEYRGQPIPPRISMAIRDICGFMRMRDKCMRTDSMAAKRYQDMLDQVMGSEELKAKDAKQSETLKIDKMTQRLEDMGAIRNGELIGYDELRHVLADAHGSYETSMDVVDCMMFSIVNTMRRNLGDSELSTLPVSAQVKDVKGELLSKISKDEEKILSNLGIKPPERDVR